MSYILGRIPLGVSPPSSYRWRRASLRDAQGLSGSPPPRTPYEALPEERAAVRAYALKHPGIRHRERCCFFRSGMYVRKFKASANSMASAA